MKKISFLLLATIAVYCSFVAFTCNVPDHTPAKPLAPVDLKMEKAYYPRRCYSFVRNLIWHFIRQQKSKIAITPQAMRITHFNFYGCIGFSTKQLLGNLLQLHRAR